MCEGPYAQKWQYKKRNYCNQQARSSTDAWRSAKEVCEVLRLLFSSKLLFLKSVHGYVLFQERCINHSVNFLLFILDLLYVRKL